MLVNLILSDICHKPGCNARNPTLKPSSVLQFRCTFSPDLVPSVRCAICNNKRHKCADTRNAKNQADCKCQGQHAPGTGYKPNDQAIPRAKLGAKIIYERICIKSHIPDKPLGKCPWLQHAVCYCQVRCQA